MRKIQSKPFLFWLIPILAGAVLYFRFNLSIYVAFAGFLTLITLFDFLFKLGKQVVILEILILSAVVQWLLMPAIAYHLPVHFMAVEVDGYMALGIPCTLAIIIGLNWQLRKINFDHRILIPRLRQYLGKHRTAGYVLFGVGFVASNLSGIPIPGFNFLIYILSNLLFIGALYIFFTPSPIKFPVLAGIIIMLVYSTVKMGMFGDLFFWLMFFGIILSLDFKFPFWLKIASLFVGLSMLFLIQSIKQDFRSEIWFTEDVAPEELNQFDVIFGLISEQLSNPSELVGIGNLYKTYLRLNQGKLTSFAMDHVPNKEPFAKGETVFVSIAASFVPRFLWPGKPSAGGQEMFYRFTGIKLHKRTSMNIGPIGEAYVNFNILGAPFFMLFYGLFIGFVFKSILLAAIKRPTLFLWIPMIFFAVIKAETDTVTVFNFLIKNVVFMALFYWFFEHALRFRI